MAGSIKIFRIELDDYTSGVQIALAGGREFVPACFYLELGDALLRLDTDQALRFASEVRRLSWRRRELKPGAVWSRELGGDGDAPIRVALGLVEGGCVYVEIGSTKIVCDEQQTDDLVRALQCFADDVDMLTGRTAEVQQLNLTPAIVADYMRRGSRW
jgi:hypothetical protein